MKVILLTTLLSFPAVWAGAQGAAAIDKPPAPSTRRAVDDIDIYLNMGGLKPLDQWSFTLEVDDLRLAVPPEAFATIGDTLDNIYLRISMHLLAKGERIWSTPVTLEQRIPMQSRQITGTNSECFLFNSTSVVVNFTGKQIYDAIKAMNTSYSEGATTVLVPEVLRAQAASDAGTRGAKQKDHPVNVYVPVPASGNLAGYIWGAQVSVASFNTNKLVKVSSAQTIEERELALFVKQEADAAATEAFRKDLEVQLASETAARKAAEEKLASLVDQEVKERQATLQKIEARLLAMESALTNFAQVEFKKFAEEFSGKFQQQVQVVSNVSLSVSSLVTNLAVTGQKVNAIGAAVDKLNGRSGWGNVFKRSETTKLGK